MRDELHAHDLPPVRLVLEGEPRPLQPCAAEESFLICREALLNAFRHSGAEAIEVEVGYGRRALSVRIRDDGTGLPDPAVDRDGHYGLRGMRERAERLGAELQIWSRPDAGTEVQLRIPHARAYATQRGSRRKPDASRPQPPGAR